MLKKEFLEKLSMKLNLINEAERNDILVEYSTYIDDKINNGFSEEDAVAGFGNIDELAKEVLDAYKINTEQSDPIMSHTNDTIDKVYQKAESTLSKLGNLSMNDLLHLLFDAFVLVIILWISKVIIADLLCGLILSFIDFMFNFTNVYNYLKKLIDIVYSLFAIYFFIRVMSKRIQRYKSNNRNIGVMDDIKSTWNQQMNEDLPPIPDEKPLYHERKNVQSIQSENIIKKFLLIIGMIISIMMVLGGLVWVLVAIMITIIYQLTSIGMYLMAIGFFLTSLSLLFILIKLWPKKEVETCEK